MTGIGHAECNLVLMQNPDPEHLERGEGRAVERFADALGLEQAPGETALQFRARAERALNARPGDTPARWTVPL